MKRKTNKLQRGTVICALLVLCYFYSCKSKTTESTSPNIIVFLVDDMGLMDSSVPFLTDTKGNPVSYALNDFYKTPHMERLSKQGIRFSNFYAHSVCSPSRTSILTGQNAIRHGVTNWIRSEKNNRTAHGPSDWNWKGLTKTSVTLPRVLQDEGYKTIHIGKAHFGPFNSEGADPRNLGFDVNIAGSSIGHPGSYLGTEGFGHIAGNKKRAVPGLEKYHNESIFLTEALTLEANAAISAAKEEGKPFFLHMSHYAVHAPFYSDERFAKDYNDSKRSEKAKAYATLVAGVDKSLGDILQHVRALDMGENTLILFLGDNGSDAPLPIVNNYSSAAPLKGKKGNHWEGGMRVPFIASWISPNAEHSAQRKTPIAQNVIQQQQGTILDLFATLTQVANVSIPKDHIDDGVPLQKQFNGKTNQDRKEIFINHFPHGNHRSNYFTSMVASDWKISYHYPIKKAPRYELFHLKEDPFETTNLAATHPEKVQKMMRLLMEEMEAKKARYPEINGQVLKPALPLEKQQ